MLPTKGQLIRAQIAKNLHDGYLHTELIRLRQRNITIEDVGDAWLCTPKTASHFPTYMTSAHLSP